MLVVALVAAVSAGISMARIWQLRTAGTYDPDEAGYLADALRYHRNIDLAHPLAVPREVLATATAPLVPLLSVPLLVVGPRDPRAALLVQPLLYLATVVMAAALVRRFAGAGWTILAGVVVASLPTMLRAAEAYWFGLAAATAMTAALLALVRSDRLANRWRFAYGAAMGAMLLSRTMTLAFLPGLVGAGLWLAWGERRRLRGLAEAVVVAALVAVPWYVAQRDEVFGYLLGYGYGERAEEWGPSAPLARLWTRIDRLAVDMVLPGPWAVVAVVAVGFGIVEARRRGWRPGHLPDRARELLALAIAFVAGLAALASTSNVGVWFELPLVIVGVCLVMAALSVSPRPLQLVVGTWLAVMAVVSPLVLEPVDGHRVGDAFGEYDPRFAAAGGPGDEAARTEWLAVNRELVDELAELTDRGRRGVATVSGNMFVVNTNSLRLLAEEDGWELDTTVPDTFGDDPDLDGSLTPTVEGEDGARERVLVLVRHDLPSFTPDVGRAAFAEAARAAGWEPVLTVPLPVGGEAEVLRHPDGERSG